MKKIGIGFGIAIVMVLLFRSCFSTSSEEAILKENSMLIQEQIANVSKLVVSEGHFAEVYNYKDSQKLFGDLISADKKALVVVNAEVTVQYDLRKMKVEIDASEKTVYIRSIPEPEIKINPDFEYYDVSADFLNPFVADDYNRIKNNVKNSLMRKIEASSLKTNASNRLMSELSRFYVLTNALEWKLVYEGQKIKELDDFKLTNETFIY